VRSTQRFVVVRGAGSLLGPTRLSSFAGYLRPLFGRELFGAGFAPLTRLVKVGLGYKERWKVERTFAWLGNCRRLLVRHERYLSTFRRAFVLVLPRYL
jgi:hypothetical protein